MSLFNWNKSEKPIRWDIEWPSQEWVDAANERAAIHTPDIVEVESKPLHNVFIYNECKDNHAKHNIIGPEAIYLYTSFTMHKYSTWMKKQGEDTKIVALEKDFPYEKLDEVGNWHKESRRFRIKGELYSVRPKLIFALDNYHKNGVEYIRKRIPILIPYRYIERIGGEVKISEYRVLKKDAWIYIGITEHWEDQLDGGFLFDTVRTFNTKGHNEWPNVEPYYCYTTPDQPK